MEPDTAPAAPASHAPIHGRLYRLFLDPQERRLRALWRLLLFTPALVAAMLAVMIVVLAVAALLRPGFPGAASRLSTLGRLDQAALPIVSFLQALLATAVTWLACRVLDHRPFAGLGLHRDRSSARDLAFGFALAGAMFAAVFATMYACGWIRVWGWAWQSFSTGETFGWLAYLGLAFVCVGWYEELLIRGYWLVNLSEGLNAWAAALVSSAVFAFGHFANPNATIASDVALLGAGLFLAYPVLRTGRLWMSIGLHIGWNFFEGPVFGFPVSGLRTFAVVRQDTAGPEALTGGAFGPEAGLVLLAVEACGAVAIWSFTRRRVRFAVAQVASSPTAND